MTKSPAAAARTRRSITGRASAGRTARWRRNHGRAARRRARRRLQRRDAGADGDVEPCPVGAACGPAARRPGSPARRCRGRPSRPGRRAALGCELEGEAHRVSSAPSGKSWRCLPAAVADEIEIEAVADQIGSRVSHGPLPASASRRRPGRGRRSRAGPALADGFGLERPGGQPMAQVARAHLRLGTSSAPAPGRQGRAFGHAPAAGLAEHGFGRCGEAGCFLLQSCGLEEWAGTPNASAAHARRARRP